MDLLLTAQSAPDLSIHTSAQAGVHLYSVLLKGKTTLFSYVDPSAIQNKTLDKFVSAFRLNDTHADRNLPDFREDWNRFWLLTNILQFLPEFMPVSDEYIHLTAEDARPVAQPAQPATDEWAQALRFADSSVSNLLQGCQNAGLAAPMIGYELADNTGRIIAVAESVWEEAKIAVLISDMDDNRPAFENAGWRTFTIDAPVQDLISAINRGNS